MGYLTAGVSRHLLIEVEKGSGALNVTWEGFTCFVYLPPFWSAQYLVPQPGSSGWSTGECLLVSRTQPPVSTSQSLEAALK